MAAKALPKRKSKTGPQIMDAMQETVTLDRFYDRNPWKGGPKARAQYLRDVVERNRRERAIYIAKAEAKEDK